MFVPGVKDPLPSGAQSKPTNFLTKDYAVLEIRQALREGVDRERRRG
jgi:hypothetical protein